MWELYRDEEINTNFNDLEAGSVDAAFPFAPHLFFLIFSVAIEDGRFREI